MTVDAPLELWFLPVIPVNPNRWMFVLAGDFATWSQLPLLERRQHVVRVNLN